MTRDLLLAIDVGNTDTVFALFRADRLLAEWRAGTTAVGSAGKAAQTIRLLLAEAGAGRREMRGAVISSVVPAATAVLSAAVRKRLGAAPYVVTGRDPAGMRVSYRTPGTLGPDRLCNAVAARARYGAPVIVVDIGTAVTYDVVLRSGVFAGGAIAPGIAAMASALERKTAALPPIALELPPRAIGRDTVECMQSGVMYGAIDAIEGMIRRIRATTGRGTTVVATGGHAWLLARHSRLIAHVEPSLVLDGARLLFERRSRRR